MRIIISPEALIWFKEEMNIQIGEAVRFFVRYGGCSTVQSGFSLGITKEPVIEDCISSFVEGRYFFVHNEDEWYFQNHDLHVSVNKDTQEIAFEYK